MIVLSSLSRAFVPPLPPHSRLLVGARHRVAMSTVANDDADAAWRLGPGWQDALSDHLGTESFLELKAFVERERASSTVLPAPRDQFNAFMACDFDQVRVVILGQDPYPTPGHAHGLAFSVMPSVPKLPGSLRNIYKELKDDLDIEPPAHGCLTQWSDQGVLLLNTVLTVRAGEPASHSKRGWEEFTGAAIRALATRRSDLIFMLWGNAAQQRGKLIDPSSSHLVLTAKHPSVRSRDIEPQSLLLRL